MVRRARRRSLSTVVPGTSERLFQKGHLSSKWTYKLWEARATRSSYPSLWPGLPRPPGAVATRRGDTAAAFWAQP